MSKNLEAMHNANDAFVKSQQAKTAPMAGHNPQMKAEMKKFNSFMSNDGDKAQDMARSLTAGMDKKAYPVK